MANTINQSFNCCMSWSDLDIRLLFCVDDVKNTKAAAPPEGGSSGAVSLFSSRSIGDHYGLCVEFTIHLGA